MHELGIARNIVNIVSERSAGRKVLRVKLEIGRLSAILPDAIEFCFDVCAKNTTLENALLEIEEIDGRGTCEACHQEMPLENLFGQCACGSRNIRCTHGQELNIKEMEIR